MKITIKILFLLISLPVYSQTVLDKEYIFDDFKYERLAFPATGDSSGSMFGKNPWVTRKGIEYSKAWSRLEGTDSNAFNKGMVVNLDSVGFSLEFTRDYKLEYGYIPGINSDFILPEGTFATRIKFSEFKTDKLMQSFFLYSPGRLEFGNTDNPVIYWSEIDFEFNNCWHKNNEPRMGVGCNNYNGKPSILIDMNCIVRHKDNYNEFENCYGSFMGHTLLQENWYILVFRVNKLLSTLEIEAFSDDEDLPFELWGGFSHKAGNWGRPYTIQNYFPQYKMMSIYLLGACGSITKEISLKSDWYFYSPNPNLSGSEILSQVNNLRKAGIERINTTQHPTFADVEKFTKDNLSISGPLTASVCRLSKWTIEPLYKGRHAYRINYKYRVYSQNSASKWHEVYKPEIEYLPNHNDDSLEIMLVYKDEWVYDPDTLFHSCTFQIVPCDDLIKSVRFSSLYPNPADEELTLEIEVLYPSEVSLEIFDILGNKISNIYEGYLSVGKYNYTVNTSGFADGTYYVRAISPIGTGVRRFIKLRY